MKYILAIDKGTSVVKCILYDQEGGECAIALRESQTNTPKLGWHEEDLDSAWILICELIKEVIEKSKLDTRQIVGIGITSHMGGLIILDENFTPLYPNVLWDDNRASSIIEKWDKSGQLEEIVKEGGQAILPGLTIPLLKWFELNQPDLLSRAKVICNTKDYLVYRFTGTIGTDESDGGWMPFDVRKRSYSRRIWELAEVEQHAHLFPMIRKSDQVAGTLLPSVASELGLEAGIPVLTGIGDANASTIGVGVIKPGQGVSIIGTSLLNNIITETVIDEPKGLGFNIPTVESCWMRMLPNTGGGSINIKWLIDIFYKNDLDPYQSLEIDVTSSKIGSKGIMFHPYISNAGVVAPFYHLGARAQFTGLHLGVERSDIARAIFEGIAYSIRDCYEACPIPLEEVRLSGGAARSKALCQIVADVLGKPVILTSGEEAAARGVAILVSVAVGLYTTIHEAADHFINIRQKYYPDLSHHQIYSQYFDLFKKTRIAMERIWTERQKIYSTF
ncbi:MAG: FGGY-family carbohydrate kinase [Thermosphaera sp.]